MSFRGWYNERIVPSLIKCACSAPAVMAIRSRVVPLANGAVFEIGCGGGINQALYDPQKVTSYAGMDPSEKGLDFARQSAAANGMNADIRHGFGEAIPFDDGSFDCVVCTYTLCSVSNPLQSLGELRRILKPGGTLLFAEHGLAPDINVQIWQRRIEPVWKRIAGGCHLTRPVGQAIVAGGFELAQYDKQYAPQTPRFAGWMEWGRAIRTA